MDMSQLGALRSQPVPPQKLLIDGAWVAASDGGEMDVISPLNGQPLTT